MTQFDVVVGVVFRYVVTCSSCKGRGWLRTRCKWRDGKSIELPCHECRGEGKVETCRERPLSLSA